MRWYVGDGAGGATGPYTDEQVLQAIAAGQVSPVAPTRGDVEADWVQLRLHPRFADAVARAQAEATARASAANRRVALIGVAAVALIPSGLGAAVWAYDSWSYAPKPRSAAVAQPASQPAPPMIGNDQREADRLLAKGTLGEVVAMLKPLWKDTVNTDDPMAGTLALWATMGGGFVWKELESLPATTVAKVKKDPTAERGRRLCLAGTVVEIHAKRITEGAYYDGNIVSDAEDVVSFLAAGLSGDIVERTRAKVCGVVTGTNSYTNAAGGTTHAVRLVGAFDLPDNHDDNSKIVYDKSPMDECCKALAVVSLGTNMPLREPANRGEASCRVALSKMKTKRDVVVGKAQSRIAMWPFIAPKECE